MYPVFDVVGLLVDRVRFKMFCGNTCDPPKDLRFSDMPNHQKKPCPSTRLFFAGGVRWGDYSISFA